MKISEIRQNIKDYEALNAEINRIEHILNQGVNEIVIKENYFLRENLFKRETFKVSIEDLLRQELETLVTQRNEIGNLLNIEEGLE